MTQWEYKIVQDDYTFSGPAGPRTSTLDYLGKQGWELVSAITEIYKGCVTMIFKRPLKYGNES